MEIGDAKPNELQGMVTTAEAMKRLGITRRAVLDRIKSGELVAVQVTPRLFLITVESLERTYQGPRPRGPKRDPNSMRGRRERGEPGWWKPKDQAPPEPAADPATDAQTGPQPAGDA